MVGNPQGGGTIYIYGEGDDSGKIVGTSSITIPIATFASSLSAASKFFVDGGGVDIIAANTDSPATHFAIFAGDPSAALTEVQTRTPTQVKTDLSLNNVENTALSAYSRAGIDSRTSFPPDPHAITDHNANNWKMFYSNGSAAVVELTLGSSGQVLKSNGTNNAPIWATDNDTVYTHPTQTAITESAADGKVLSAIGVDTLGHVTSVGTKTLAEVDIPALAQSKITNLTTDLSNKLSLSGGTMTGSLTLNSDPTNNLHAATKQYVDSLKQGLDIKDSVKVATNQSLGQFYYSAVDSSIVGLDAVILPDIDGITLSINDRILVKNETATQAKYNGIYRVHFLGEDGEEAWVLARSNDAKMSEQVTAGMFTFVEEGNTNGDTGWVLTTNDPISLNFTPLTFAQFSAAGQIYDGSGLIKTGKTIHVGQGTGILVSDNSVAHADTSTLSSSQGGNGISSITVDSFGHVTAVGTPTSAYLTSGTVCAAIVDCTIDGGTFS